jgi:hypothetical protein
MAVNDLFNQDLKVVNLGLKSFHNDLKSQGITAVHVNWKPKAGGKKNMLNLLSKINKPR